MTAMSEAGYLGEKTPFMNFATVKAVIRKDMRTLWPLAAAVAVLALLAAVFTHEPPPLPDLSLSLGGDWSIELRPLVWGLLYTFALAGGSLFIVMLAQQDRATDVRNDWMARPIKAGELVLAKGLVVAAVVAAPAIAGTAIAVATGMLANDIAVLNLFFVLLGCVLVLTLGWLCSGILQAVLATFGIVILTLLMTFVSIRMSQPREFAAVEQPAVAAPTAPGFERIPAPAPEFAPVEQPAMAPRAEGQGPSEMWSRSIPIASGLLAAVMAGAGVTLWLLLGRRQVMAARLTFVGLYSLGVLGLTQSITVVDRSVAVPAATLEQRMAAFRKNDANGDLKLDKAEYDKVLTDLGFGGQMDTYWPQRDVNNDGFIDAEEMQRDLGVLAPAATLQQRMNAFTQNDADKDGKLTKEEYAAALKMLGYSNQLEEYWLQRDANKDGFISVEEYVPAIQ